MLSLVEVFRIFKCSRGFRGRRFALRESRAPKRRARRRRGRLGRREWGHVWRGLVELCADGSDRVVCKETRDRFAGDRFSGIQRTASQGGSAGGVASARHSPWFRVVGAVPSGPVHGGRKQNADQNQGFPSEIHAPPSFGQTGGRGTLTNLSRRSSPPLDHLLTSSFNQLLKIHIRPLMTTPRTKNLAIDAKAHHVFQNSVCNLSTISVFIIF